MTRRSAILLGIGAFVAILLAAVTLLLAGQALADVRSESAGVAEVISYQGYLTGDQGQPIDGLVKLDFTIRDGAGGIVWTETRLDVLVTEGFFDVLLGTNNPLNAGIFDDPERYLEVAVNDGATLPGQRLASVPYSFQADVAPWDGISGMPAGFSDGNDDGSNYENVIVVAKSGGHFTSVQSAIDSISGASADNPSLVWIAPGTYTESVTMKSDVHLQGAGQNATIISSEASTTGFPPAATLVLASSTSVRDLTVRNSGSGDNTNTAAIVGSSGISQTQLLNVEAEGQGTGWTTYGIYIRDEGTAVNLVDVTASAQGATGPTASNTALHVQGISSVLVTRGSYTARGGTIARGIAIWTDSRASVTDAFVLSESGESNFAVYIYNSNGNIYGGSYNAIDGNSNSAIFSISAGDSTSLVTVTLATARAEGGSSSNFGFNNANGGGARLTGSHFTASGGTGSYGIFNANVDIPVVILDVTSVGEEASGFNYGLYNAGVVTGTLRNSSFTAQGQGTVQGIRHEGGKLDGTNIFAGAEGGTQNYGMIVIGSSSDVSMAQSVFSGSSAAISRSGGTVTVANSRLVDGPALGIVSCTLVSRGTAINSGTICP